MSAAGAGSKLAPTHRPKARTEGVAEDAGLVADQRQNIQLELALTVRTRMKLRGLLRKGPKRLRRNAEPTARQEPSG